MTSETWGRTAFLKKAAEGNRYVEGCDPLHRGVEIVESLVLNGGRQLRAQAAETVGFVNEHRAISLGDGRQNRVEVERLQTAEIDHRPAA